MCSRSAGGVEGGVQEALQGVKGGVQEALEEWKDVFKKRWRSGRRCQEALEE